jgi:hypothetical protein
LTALTPETLAANAKTPVQISLTGTNFDQIRYVQFGEDVKSRFLLEPVAGSSTSATISVTNLDSIATVTNTAVSLPVRLITTSGQQVGTSKQLTITPAATTPPVVASPAPANPEKPDTVAAPTPPAKAPAPPAPGGKKPQPKPREKKPPSKPSGNQ